MPRTVRELTTAVASGDPEALAVLYRERFDWLYAEAQRCTGRDESFCLDVVQDVMMKMIRKMKPLNDEGQLIAWLRTVLHRCAYDRLRAERRLRQREREVAINADASTTANIDDSRLDWLAAQLTSLNAEQSQLIRLRFRLGWTLHQVAAFLGLKPGAVDGRINRTLATLKERAAEDAHE